MRVQYSGGMAFNAVIILNLQRMTVMMFIGFAVLLNQR